MDYWTFALNIIPYKAILPQQKHRQYLVILELLWSRRMRHFRNTDIGKSRNPKLREHSSYLIWLFVFLEFFFGIFFSSFRLIYFITNLIISQYRFQTKNRCILQKNYKSAVNLYKYSIDFRYFLQILYNMLEIYIKSTIIKAIIIFSEV